MIMLEAFEPFMEHPKNTELVEKGLYGVILLDETTNEWTPISIEEQELVKYEHVIFEHIEDGPIKDKLMAEASLLSHDQCTSWPMVKKINW